MGEMVVGIPAHLSDPKGSCHDACKGAERDDQTTIARTSLLSRMVVASEKIPEPATTVQVQIRKKPLRSSKLPVNFKRRTTGKSQRQEIPAYTKRLAVSGGSSIAQDSPLDGATGTPNKGSRMDKNTASSKLGNKRAVGKPANLEKIEHELSYLRRNSTGNLGIEMGDSKVLPRYMSVPTGSSDDGKDGAELNCKTKVRTHMSKTSANFRRLKTSHGKEMQACTKTLAFSARHRSDLKLKPLEENDYSVMTRGFPRLQWKSNSLKLSVRKEKWER